MACGLDFRCIFARNHSVRGWTVIPCIPTRVSLAPSSGHSFYTRALRDGVYHHDRDLRALVTGTAVGILFCCCIFVFLITMGEREYVCCKNPQCRPNGPTKHSWKFVDLLPAACIFCGTNFKAKSNRWDRRGAWKPTPTTTQPPQRKAKTEPVDGPGTRLEEERDRKWLVDMCKQTNPDWTPEQIDNYVKVIRPVREKTPAEVRKEVIENIETTRTAHQHKAKQLQSMQAALRKRAEEFKEYEKRVEEQKEASEKATQKYQEAKLALDVLDASTGRAAPAAADATTSAPTTSFAADLGRALNEGLPNGAAVDGRGLHSTILQLFEVHAKALQPSMAQPAHPAAEPHPLPGPALPPPREAPDDGQAPMDAKSENKRGAFDAFEHEDIDFADNDFYYGDGGKVARRKSAASDTTAAPANDDIISDVSARAHELAGTATVSVSQTAGSGGVGSSS